MIYFYDNEVKEFVPFKKTLNDYASRGGLEVCYICNDYVPKGKKIYTITNFWICCSECFDNFPYKIDGLFYAGYKK